MNLEQVVIIYR